MEQKRAGLDGYSPGKIEKSTARRGEISDNFKVYAMALWARISPDIHDTDDLPKRSRRVVESVVAIWRNRLRQHATTIQYQRKNPLVLVTAGFAEDRACRVSQPQALAASLASLSMRDE